VYIAHHRQGGLDSRESPANALLAITGEPNTSIHSAKALTCNIRPGRSPMREAAE